MNYTATVDQRQLVSEVIGSLDHAAPQEQMKAIDTALRRYFEAEDWLAERDRRFPGLFRVRHQ